MNIFIHNRAVDRYSLDMGSTRSLLGALLATLALLLVAAVPARAADFNLAIDNAVLDLGSIGGVKAIDSTSQPPDPPATLTGTLKNGQVKVPRAKFVFPTKTTEVTNGLEATVDLSANKDITGRFDAATGELTLAFDLKATVQALDQTCVIDPIRASLSTRYGKPYLGVPFSDGIDGPGALSGHWDDLPAPTGGMVCQIVGQVITGPGGIWMAHGLAEPRKCEDDPSHPGCDESNPCANEPCPGEDGQPKLSLSVSPKSKKVKAGRSAVLKVKIKNSGDGPASGAKVCAKVPRKKAQTRKCFKVSVPAHKSLTRKFRIKVKKKARGSLKATFKLTAPGSPARTAKAKIKILRK